MIDVIIPVFNAHDELLRCLDSLRRHRGDTAFRLLLLDDASSDVRVASLLQSVAEQSWTETLVLSSPRNLGFVATVNRALEQGRNDVVLLNSDTRVCAGWLEALLDCAARDERIATVTPFTNNGEICSYPVFCRATSAEVLDADAIAAAMAALPAHTPCPDLPTGVGFCMFVRRRALAQIGLFDAGRFGAGYGEENDFCWRARAAGWRNVLCPRAFVLHTGGASFGQESAELKARNLPLLQEQHPDYEQAVRDFVATDPLQGLRARVAQTLAAAARDAHGLPARPGLLLVTHDFGGGVEKHVRDLAALLAAHARVEILRPFGAAAMALEDAAGTVLRLPLTGAAGDYEAWIALLQRRRYARVHFHHLHGFAPQVLELARALDLPYDLTLHDFTLYCPQYALATAEGEYCGEPALAGCEACVAARPHAWGIDVATWRERLGAFARGAARVIAPSAFVRAQVLRHFPDLEVQLLPHPPRHEWLALPPAPFKVLILGGLSRSKGMETVTSCARAARAGALPLAFTILGYTERPVPGWPELPLSVRGEYADRDLPALAALERADVLWFPGRIPESYSYTLDIALELGLPIVATDRGAVAERLRARGIGTLVPADADPAQWNRALLEAAPARPVGSEHRAALLARRNACRATLLAPLARDGEWPLVQPLSQQEAALHRPELAREQRELSLQALYEHGVQCGHAESRAALRARLQEIAADQSVLRAYEQRAGKPWYEQLHEAEATAQALRQSEARILDMQYRHETRILDMQQQHEAVVTGLRQIQHALVTQHDARITEMQQQHEAAIAGLQAEHAARIAEFQQSTSWRLTAPLRATRTFWRARVDAPFELMRRRVPLALQLAREEGPATLLRRVWRRLDPPSPAPPQQPQVPGLAAIAPLELRCCTPDARPRVSIVIPTYGQHQHTFNCLLSLAEHTDLAAAELIVVDDAFPEPLTAALAGTRGVQWLRNERNQGFIGSCEAGTARARGEFIVLLNNDVQVCAGWLDALLSVFERRADAGLAGARLVYPDGRLQEAGGIVWRDGSAWNWGRGADPEHPYYRYLRAVDYCSGACLLLRAADWRALGGFDPAYRPAYYEDTDLAMRVRARGKRVYYQPEALVIHHEGITSGTDTAQGAKRHQLLNQGTFLARWQTALASHRPNGVEARREADREARAWFLVVEACMIAPDEDSGSVRMLAMLELLVELGCKVAFVADNLEQRQPYVRQLQQLGVEVWHAPYVDSVAQLLEQEGPRFSHIMFCRHYIAAPYMADVRRWAPHATIVFDTVDLHYLREQRLAELEQAPKLFQVCAQTRAQELGVIGQADVTLVVSPVEQELLAREAPGARVEILSNIHEARAGTPGFEERDGLLFVGGFQHPPNVDAVHWFLQEVWPLVHARAPAMSVRIVGSKMPESLRALAAPGVEILGFVPELEPLLSRARVSIAPLRYGAGVKGKINEAMAHGLPVVATGAAVEGMHLAPGEQVLVADTAQSFAEAVLRLHADAELWRTLAAGGKRSVALSFSRAAARQALERLLGA